MTPTTQLPSLALATTMVLGAAAPYAFGAVTSQHYRFQGERAQASLVGTDSSGCVFYEPYVSLIAGLVKQNGHPNSSSQLVVNINRFNICTSEFLPTIFAFVESLPPEDIRTDRQLLSAGLNTSATGHDFDGNSFPFVIRIAWTGVKLDPPTPPFYERNASHFQRSYQNLRLSGFEKATRRSGFAEGSMMLDGEQISLADTGFCRGGGFCSPLDWITQGFLTISVSSDPADWNGTHALLPIESAVSFLAAARPTGFVRFTSEAAVLTTSTIDSTGCVVTIWSVTASDGVWNENGSREIQASVGINYEVLNICTSEVLAEASGAAADLPDSQLHIDHQIKDARVNTTVILADSNGNTFPAHADLIWQGFGKLYARSHEFAVDKFYTQFFTYSRASDENRLANVSGTISLPQTAIAVDSVDLLFAGKLRQMGIDK